MFAPCEHALMSKDQFATIAELRKELGLTLEAFGLEVGLRSKGQVSEIEKSNRCSPEVALAIEALSSRRLDASILNQTIEAARRSVAA